MSKVTEFFLTAQKTVAAASAAVAIIIADGLVDGTTAKWLVGGLAAVGTFLVYILPKKNTSGDELEYSHSELTDAIAATVSKGVANATLPETTTVETTPVEGPVAAVPEEAPNAVN